MFRNRSLQQHQTFSTHFSTSGQHNVYQKMVNTSVLITTHQQNRIKWTCYWVTYWRDTKLITGMVILRCKINYRYSYPKDTKLITGTAIQRHKIKHNMFSKISLDRCNYFDIRHLNVYTSGTNNVRKVHVKTSMTSK